MKAEITPENKAKFFAQYWGQNIFHWKYPEHATHENVINKVSAATVEYANCGSLSLKPLSSISDEDALEVFGFDNFFEYSKDNNHRYFNKSASEALLDTLLESHLSLELNAYSVDFLRSKGYAVDWMGLTVQEMIEAGWIKLI